VVPVTFGPVAGQYIMVGASVGSCLSYGSLYIKREEAEGAGVLQSPSRACLQ
jgi:hypothetical protein